MTFQTRSADTLPVAKLLSSMRKPRAGFPLLRSVLRWTRPAVHSWNRRCEPWASGVGLDEPVLMTQV